LQALALTIYFFKLIWESLKNFAKAKEVAALANSEGCIESFKSIPTTLTSYGFTKKKRPANDNKKQQNDTCIFFINLPSIASIMKIKGIVNKIKQTVWYVSSIDDKDEE
jgi:hypothetical protein